MARPKKALPEGAREEAMEPEAVDGIDFRKTGLNYSDVNALVRAVVSGMSWDEAKQSACANVREAALESYKDEVLRRAAEEQKVGATLSHHDKVSAREGERLAAIAQARGGRKRLGLNSQETDTIVAMLRDGQTWREVEKRYLPVIDGEALASWREPLEARAANGDQPMLRPKPAKKG